MSTRDKVRERAMSTRGRGGAAKTIGDQIACMVPQLAKALPKHMDAERMGRIALTEFKKNKALASCSPDSFFGSLMTASQLGLEPGPLGLAYLIPYKGQVTLQLGYRGLLELVWRSGKVDTIYAYPVFEGDDFVYQLGISPDIKHTPCGEDDPDKLLFVYAVAWIKDAALPRLEVMSRQQVETIRKRSSGAASGKSTPWSTDFVEMARKTALKRLCKTLPLSIEIQSKIAKDETFRTSIDVEEAENMFMLGEEEIPVEEKPAPKTEAGKQEEQAEQEEEKPLL